MPPLIGATTVVVVLLYDRTVIGYHGCDTATARNLLRGRAFRPSTNEHDWLGSGVYFWEFGPERAFQWARETASRLGAREKAGTTARFEPAVVGAVIQLGNCFDLCDTSFTGQLRETFAGLNAAAKNCGVPLPRNAGNDSDLKQRKLDCYVINTHLAIVEAHGGTHYDTVRGVFVEGPPAFEGAMIREKTHVQIAVRNPACIIGVFRPRISRS